MARVRFFGRGGVALLCLLCSAGSMAGMVTATLPVSVEVNKAALLKCTNVHMESASIDFGEYTGEPIYIQNTLRGECPREDFDYKLAVDGGLYLDTQNNVRRLCSAATGSKTCLYYRIHGFKTNQGEPDDWYEIEPNKTYSVRYTGWFRNILADLYPKLTGPDNDAPLLGGTYTDTVNITITFP